MIAQDRQPYLKTRNDVDFQFFGSPTVLHATGEATDGRFCLMEQATMPPGLASPYHTHHNEDEAFYVLDGEVSVYVGDQVVRAQTGDFLWAPREVPHAFCVESPLARMLVVSTPGGEVVPSLVELRRRPGDH